MESEGRKYIYINGLGCISPQPTFSTSWFLDEPTSLVGNRMKALDPNYKEFVPPELVRRMGRIIKMGVAAAKSCVADAGGNLPDAIITGTGLGCIEDTEKFLGNMIANNEEFLTPTAFIQSTHNTVSAQIALLLKCHGYNFTYVHRGFSFESAILDSILQIENGRASSILLGAADELTDHSFMIQERMGYWRRKASESLEILSHPSKGTIAGEGASFFFLESKKSPNTYAKLLDVEMIYKPNSIQEVISGVRHFLERNGLKNGDIDLLMLGYNGDSSFDKVYQQVANEAFPGIASCGFKHLCGEYMTASSFGLWVGSKILKEQRLPGILHLKKNPATLKNILLYNHYRGINHSLILLSRS